MPGIVFHREPRGSSHIERGGRVPAGAELFARTIGAARRLVVTELDIGGGIRYRFLTLER